MVNPQLFSIVISVSFLTLSFCSQAQTTNQLHVERSSTSNAETSQLSRPNIANKSSGDQGSASASGVIVDQSGAPVSSAKVTLTGSDGKNISVGESSADGKYQFDRLPAGPARITVSAKGFQAFISDLTTLVEGQTYVAPTTVLSLAITSTEVNVQAKDPKVASEQLKAEEKQRIFGFVPNFYTSYLPGAAALSTKQKYSLALRDTFDPIRFVGTAVGASIQQANGTYPGYGAGAAGFGKRYAALYGDGLSSDLLSHAVFPALFHQDPRYFYQGTGSLKSRFVHAISFSVAIRSDKGRNVPNYSYLLADLGSGALSNLYYPHADRGLGLVLTNAAIGLAARAGGSIIREFILTRVTTNVPGKGKP